MKLLKMKRALTFAMLLVLIITVAYHDHTIVIMSNITSFSGSLRHFGRMSSSLRAIYIYIKHCIKKSAKQIQNGLRNIQTTQCTLNSLIRVAKSCGMSNSSRCEKLRTKKLRLRLAESHQFQRTVSFLTFALLWESLETHHLFYHMPIW